MPALCSVNIAHVLKAEIVGHLSGRQKGVAGEITGQKGEAVKRDGMQLGLVGDGLFNRVTLRIVI